MINQVMATGTSSVNLRLPTHRGRQKQRLKRFKSFALLLFLIITVHFIWINIPVPAEQLIYQPTVVQYGDTLWGLAENTGIHMDTRTLVLKIMSFNSLANSTIIPGQTIYIPCAISTIASN
ncbi:MAG: LysM peptidoglycan-binding domain-containing protein [Desulfitobacteriaceae bacterium]